MIEANTIKAIKQGRHTTKSLKIRDLSVGHAKFTKRIFEVILIKVRARFKARGIKKVEEPKVKHT